MDKEEDKIIGSYTHFADSITTISNLIDSI